MVLDQESWSDRGSFLYPNGLFGVPEDLCCVSREGGRGLGVENWAQAPGFY